jgi:protein ImuB
VVDQGSLLSTLSSLARALLPAFDRHGLGARHLSASFFRIDGEVARLDVKTASPLKAPDRIAALFAERLTALASEWDAGFGFDVVRLAVHHAEPFETAQIDLGGEAKADASLAHLYDRLGARLGGEKITRFRPLDTHIPERAVDALPMTEPAPMKDTSWEAPGTDGSEMPPDRPLRLFARPEPVEVMAEVPEGPPLRFRWRRVIYEVARAEGPERIAPEWWRAEDRDRSTRDYFRVEDAEGRRYWIFREGLYGRETARPLWYVHGLFG